MASLTVAIQQLAIVSSEVTTILNTVRYYTHTHTQSDDLSATTGVLLYYRHSSHFNLMRLC